MADASHRSICAIRNARRSLRRAPQLHRHIVSVALTVTLLPGLGCASQDLGHGYRLVARQEATSGTPNAFESIAHYTDLYCGLRKLGTVGQFSVSPTGRYAVFEDNGRLLLFDKTAGKLADVTDAVFAIPSNFDWEERERVLQVEYYEGHAPSRIRLPG